MKLRYLFIVFLILAFACLALPARQVTAQVWKSVAIDYKDSKDHGKFAAEYKIVRQRRGCRMTIRVINKTAQPIASYWFKFLFSEGGSHENRMTDHQPGDAQELDYGKCGLKSVQISEVE